MNPTMNHYIRRGLLYEVRAINPATNGNTRTPDRVRVVGYIVYDPSGDMPLRDNAKTPNGWRVVLKNWAFHNK